MVAIARDTDTFDGAVAMRAHLGLLFLQAVLSGLASVALWWIARAAGGQHRRGVPLAAAVAIVSLICAAAIFTKNGLTDYGAYES